MGSRLEANSHAVRRRIEKHKFDDEEGEEYGGSKFGGFTEYFRRKKIKLQNLDAELRSQVDKEPIFRGVVAHVNGYTQPSLNDLHTLIVSYGGGFMQYLDGKTTVTHIIASNLTPKKKVEFSRYRIVKPAWVVDSIEAGRLLPWDAYRVVDEGIGQRVLGFDKGNITSQASKYQSGYRDQTNTSWYTSQVKDVADELNARDPEAPFPSTQIPDAGPSDGETKDNGRTSRLDDQQARNKSATPVDAKDEPTGLVDTFGSSIDSDLVPAADDTLTESLSTTQDAMDKLATAENGNFDASPNKSGLSLVTRRALTPPTEDAKLSQSSPLGTSPKDHVMVDPNLHIKPESVAAGSSPSPSHPCPAIPGVMPENASRRSPQKIADMTPEEHNALLLADPKVRKSTVVDPGFLKQYYEESRLHHLSAWKASLKRQLQELAADKSSSQRKREKRAPGARRYILHVDFDSFFAAVSLKKHPQYVDKPVVIAHGGGSGAEIASCNYPARKFGIKNGMWMKHAQKMCTELKVLPYDFKAYEEASRHFYEAIIDTGGIVQSVSIDEALVDLSNECIAAGGHDGKGIHEGSIWREQAKAAEIAQEVRDKVLEKTGCAVSVGIGGNILLAKVALRKAKPAGQYHVKPEDALDFLGELTMQDLPGIAYSIGGKLEEIGVKFVKDVRQLSKERMISVLGPKTGEKIWDYSRGIDRAEVGEQVIRKSVSAEVNWGIRFVTQEQTDEFIQSLCEELQKRLEVEGVRGRQLTLKIMRRAADAPFDPPKHLGHGKCDTFNKSVILGVPTNDARIMAREALSILKGWGFSPGELRGIGCQMQRLEALKINTDGALNDSSQKRLTFSTTPAAKHTLPTNDTSLDDIESPQKPKVTPPRHPAAAFAKDSTINGRSMTALNTSGTQFVMPSQVDQATLEELPSDIRKMLFPAKKLPPLDSPTRSRSGTPNPQPMMAVDAFPSHSQIDPDTLDALPEDVRAEVLAQYTSPSRKSHNQALLPQSPRKERAIKLPKKLTTPTKKRGRPFGALNKTSAASAFSTLTQSNFVANARASSSKVAEQGSNENGDEISDEFLSALPEELRREVMAQARRDRLQRRGGINVTTSKRKRFQKLGAGGVGQRTLHLPARPPKPSFTSKKITALPELREAMSAWYGEFGDEGPYKEDVLALVSYLKRVILEELDMEKAVSLCKWLRWLVCDGVAANQVGGAEVGAQQVEWSDALKLVEDGIQDAVKQRGLGRIAF